MSRDLVHAAPPDEWTPGHVLVTNTLKLRRAAIAERHGSTIPVLSAD
jgi:hypothetical protein